MCMYSAQCHTDWWYFYSLICSYFKVIHTKTKKPSRSDLTCFHCSRDFSTKNLLHQHIVSVHIRARPYACSVCEYTTAVASSLRMHMRQHTGEKPFKCTECDYSSADHNSLRKHKMRHTGQKSYACPLCSYSSIQASSFKKHLKAKHPGSYVTSCIARRSTVIIDPLYRGVVRELVQERDGFQQILYNYIYLSTVSAWCIFRR